MSALQISNQPYIADVLFKDGTKRKIEFTTSSMLGLFVIFKSAASDETYVNADTVQTMDVAPSAQPVGQVQ